MDATLKTFWQIRLGHLYIVMKEKSIIKLWLYTLYLNSSSLNSILSFAELWDNWGRFRTENIVINIPYNCASFFQFNYIIKKLETAYYS